MLSWIKSKWTGFPANAYHGQTFTDRHGETWEYDAVTKQWKRHLHIVKRDDSKSLSDDIASPLHPFNPLNPLSPVSVWHTTQEHVKHASHVDVATEPDKTAIVEASPVPTTHESKPDVTHVVWDAPTVTQVDPPSSFSSSNDSGSYSSGYDSGSSSYDSGSSGSSGGDF